MEVIENQNSLLTNIIQNIFFCVPQKKLLQIWTDMRVSKWWQNFHFWVD